MWWAMLIQMAASGMKAAAEAKEKRAAMIAQNEAQAKADIATVQNAQQNISSLNVLNGNLRVQAAAQLNQASEAAAAARGTAEANAAAAQVKGASADAVLNDIDRELAEARVGVQQNLEIQQFNLANRMRETLTSAVNSLMGYTEYRGGGEALGAMVNVGAQYASNYFKFGSSSSGSVAGSSAESSYGATTFGASNTAAGMTFSTGT